MLGAARGLDAETRNDPGETHLSCLPENFYFLLRIPSSYGLGLVLPQYRGFLFPFALILRARLLDTIDAGNLNNWKLRP